MSKTYLAEKQQLDTQNQLLDIYNTQLNTLTEKITPYDLTKVDVAILDFMFDDITITYGGWNSSLRRIST